MNGRGLSNSPNWYTSHACDAIDSGLFCFAAKHVLYVLDVSEPNYSKYVTSIKLDARISSISVCPNSTQSNLEVAVGLENGKLKLCKLWNNFNDDFIFPFDKENKVSCVSWSHGNPNEIACADDKGNVVLYSISQKGYKICQFIRSPTLCLKCSPHERGLVAAGFRGGSILVISFKETTPVKKYLLKGHNDDVHCLSWCPKQLKDQVFHLVSGSKDKTVKVWNVNKESCEYSLNLPSRKNFTKKNDLSGRVNHWGTVNWSMVDSSNIYVAGIGGELITWEYEKNYRNAHLIQSNPELSHTRPIFSISFCKQEDDRSILITSSLDRLINIWNAETLTNVASIPTVGGFIYALDFSPIDFKRLAVGCGDSQLRIWNLSSKNEAYNVSTYWQGIQAKITSIKWHPTREGIIAYGTDEGRVGIHNILTNKPPQISTTYHKGTVYTVTWGPKLLQKNSDDDIIFALFSCGDGIIYQHDPKNLDHRALNIDEVRMQEEKRTKKRTEISWKPDWSVVALGNEDGSIDIKSAKSFKQIIQILVHKKLIQCLTWHPQFTLANSENFSSFHCWLATSSNENDIHVFDLTENIENVENHTEDRIISSSSKSLIGHSMRIPYLSWSPHDDLMLLSCSYDCSIQVWDVKNSLGVANFRGHSERVFCAIWNPLDSNEIFSGGEDLTLQCWKIDQQSHSIPPIKSSAKIKKKKVKKKVVEKSNIIEREAAADLIKLKEPAEISIQKDVCEMPTTVNEVITPIVNDSLMAHDPTPNTTENINICLDDEEETNISMSSICGKQKKKKKMSTKSMLPLTSCNDNRGKMENQEDCLVLIRDLYGYDVDGINVNETSLIGTYLSSEDFFKMFNEEINFHEQNENIDSKLQLEIWKGNICGALHYAAKNNKLNDWLISVAASASRSLWLEMCYAYAEQLVDDGFIHKSVIYFLSCHKVYKAISVLEDKGLFREAVVLARSRLPDDNALLNRLWKKWALYADKTGNYELSAKCYLAAREPLEAARIVSKRGDSNSYRIAAHTILACSGNKDLLALYIRDTVETALTDGDWDFAFMVCNELGKHDVALVETHKWFENSLVRLKNIKNLSEVEEFGFKTFSLKIIEKIQDKDAIRSSLEKYRNSADTFQIKKIIFKVVLCLTSCCVSSNFDESKRLICFSLNDCCKAGNFFLMNDIILICSDFLELGIVNGAETSACIFEKVMFLNFSTLLLFCEEIVSFELTPLLRSLISFARIVFSAENIDSSISSDDQFSKDFENFSRTMKSKFVDFQESIICAKNLEIDSQLDFKDSDKEQNSYIVTQESTAEIKTDDNVLESSHSSSKEHHDEKLYDYAKQYLKWLTSNVELTVVGKSCIEIEIERMKTWLCGKAETCANKSSTM